jgi:iron complex transport system substrate-binding protein
MTTPPHSLNRSFNRRQVLAGAGAFGALILAGCASDTAENAGAQASEPGGATVAPTSPASTTTGSPVPTGASSSGTRSVYSNNGPVEVPANPQRVVSAIGSFDIDILAVGVVPVLTSSFAGGWVKVPDSVVITDNIPPTPEELVALKPDVMLGWNWVTLEPVFDQLSKIAPYVGLGEEEGSTWRKLFVQTCDVVNKAAEAEQLLVEFDARAAKLKEARTGRPAISMARIEFYEPGNFAWRGGADEEITAELMEAIGVEVVSYPSDIDNNNTVSLERLGEINADWIIVPTDADDRALYDEVQQLDTWKNLPAVKAGQVIEVDGRLWPGWGYLFASALLDDLDRVVVQAGL